MSTGGGASCEGADGESETDRCTTPREGHGNCTGRGAQTESTCSLVVTARRLGSLPTTRATALSSSLLFCLAALFFVKRRC